MLSLIETITGFAAIMLMLSLLVKTLTSVIKNQWDYYSDNLKHEVQRLAFETTGKAWDALIKNSKVGDLHWERLGDELLNSTYMAWFLKQLDQTAIVSDLDSRLKIHVANVKYAFEMRMKNLALAVGLGLCLLCNINAFTIWKSLYTDEQLRATFSTSYADKASALARDQATQGTDLNKKPLDAQVKDFRTNMQGFLTDVSFGVGQIWRPIPPSDKPNQPPRTPFEAFVYEFFGSLLTGILVSIGAPYWHDILQALSALRPDKAKA